MRRTTHLLVGLVGLASLAFGLRASPSSAQTLDLSAKDRESLPKYFGNAITVKAIEARRIDDPRAYLVQKDGAQWKYQVTHGKRRGQSATATLHQIASSGAAPDWKFDSGGNSILHIRSQGDGSYVTKANSLNATHGPRCYGIRERRRPDPGDIFA